MFRLFSGFVFCCSLLCCREQQIVSVPVAVSDSVTRLPYYVSADFQPHWISAHDAIPDSAHRIGAFAFTDQNGTRVSAASLAGKIRVVNFFFTSCRGICPKLTSNLLLVQKEIEADSNVVILSHSVMPETDQPAALLRYAATHGIVNPRWHLLTGNKDSLYTVARNGYFADGGEGVGKGTDYFLHTENMFLIDPEGHIRGIYKGTSPLEMQSIISDIKKLESQK